MRESTNADYEATPAQAAASAALAAKTTPPPLPPGGLPTLTPGQTSELATHVPQFDTAQVSGFTLPQTQRAIAAGSMAAANKAALMLQAGQITQAQFDQAIKALTPTSF